MAETAKQYEEHNGGLEEFYARVLNGTADYGNSKPERIRKLQECANIAYIDDFIAYLDRNGVSAVTKASPLYPRLLREIYDPPYVLYARGMRRDQPIEAPFAVIGTRRCTDYGRNVATMMGKALAEHGVTVISGLAYGCDAYAHEGALKAENNDYPTVAVLGQGVLVGKHDSTAATMEKILERGAVVSEFLPNTRATNYTFPMRNRIISGISNGVLVVEAGRKSGTMITVDLALDQGRNVYAVPCRITEPYNYGTNEMLRMCIAEAVYSPDDLLTRLGLNDSKPVRKADPLSSITDPVQRLVYVQLTLGEKSFDTLIEKTRLSVEELSLYLTELELMGLIQQLPGRIYTIA